jgi:molecular chaperone DnaJ
VVVARHPVFQRQDYDIYSTVSMSFAVAALGGSILIDTVDGKVVYDVKAGTQTGTRVRLREKGVPSLRDRNVRGDHYITLVVKTPEKLSKEAKDLLKQFDAESGNSLTAAQNAETSKDSEESGSKKKKFWNK